MMENVIERKTFEFAKSIVSVYRWLSIERREYVMSKQLLRSGTSIGANVAEAQEAQSKADFISKMSIAQKEASETSYWLRLLYETDCLDRKAYLHLSRQLDEILRLLSAICTTAKKNRQ